MRWPSPQLVTNTANRMGLILAIAVPCAVGAPPGDRALQRFDYTEIHMGVEARVVLHAPDAATAWHAARAAFDRIAELDSVMSDYRPDSELMRVCADGGTGGRAISADLHRVLRRAGEISAASGGAFDVTVGPLTRLWRDARRAGALPEPASIADAMHRAGYEHLVVADTTPAIEFLLPGMLLDLGGIGKGFAADEALAVLAAAGHARSLVDIGGDIAFGDAPPGEAGWPVTSAAEPARLLRLANCGIATSGDTEQFVEIGGIRYSHIVDPATGAGLTNRLAVTVIAADATTADALASAVSVLGLRRGRALVEQIEGASVIMVEQAREQDDSRMDWWRDARFGMFIHWGLYAIPAGTWQGTPVGGVGEWIMESARIPVGDYEPLRDRFDPVRFDAAQWARLARRAGMKYLVITTKHHDGFCLFDSALTDYDVGGAPFARDVMQELAAACRREGIRIGWYHSIMDWHHPDYLPRRPWDPRPATDADFDRYVAYLRGQVRELLTGYGPIDIMWFDGEWEPTWTHALGRGMDDYVRQLQPDIIVNNRVDTGRQGMEGLTRPGEFAGDFGTPEQQIPPEGLPGLDWETCMTMNDTWGYRSDDHDWKSADELIRILADTASKGGNFLLNVGPTALGEIPAPSVQRLEAVGDWLDANGESIYGTSAGRLGRMPWGRCTQRSADGVTLLYLHVFDWPVDRALRVPGLTTLPRRARLLAADPAGQLPVHRDGDGIVITVPGTATHAADTVIVLEVEE